MSKLVLAVLAVVWMSWAIPSWSWGQETGSPRVAGMPEPASSSAAQPAVVEAPAPAASGAQPTMPASRPGGFGPDGLLIMLAGFLVLMIVMSVIGGRKERRRRQEMMNSLQKGSRVQMAGGIIGVVTELGEDEIVVKSEDGRIRFAKSAVSAILRDGREKSTSGEVEVKGGQARAGASA